MKKATFKILNFFKEEVILKGFININEYDNNESFKLYDNEESKDFYILRKEELIY